MIKPFYAPNAIAIMKIDFAFAVYANRIQPTLIDV